MANQEINQEINKIKQGLKNLTYKEVAIGSFAVGILGLAIAVPGYLKTWNEYKVCHSKYICIHEAYEVTDPRQPRLEPEETYIGQPLQKVVGVGLALAGFVIAAITAKETAENAEYWETSDALEKTAALQNQAQKHAIDNRIGADTYEAMKAIENASLIDEFRETFFIPVTAEEIEAQIDAEQQALDAKRQQQLQQVQNQTQNLPSDYREMEFEVDAKPVEQKKSNSSGWTEATQNFYGWIMEFFGNADDPLPEVIDQEWFENHRLDGRKLAPKHWLPCVEELVKREPPLAEWVEHGKSFKIV